MSDKKILHIEQDHYSLLLSSLLNKGTAFTKKERDLFKLHGLLPPYIGNLSQQKKRSSEACKSKGSDLERYIYLRDLQDSNETLFYALILEHIDELLPIIYTPTVGLGCQRFSQIFRRPRGVFISYPLRHQLDEILSHKRFDGIRVIVVSDGERILGLGDQGAGGMGIPIGKLALYSALAGIHPRETLPILLDVGTDNEDLINDPLYLGWKNKRIRGKAYYNFIDQFVQAVKKRFPNVLLQWEDFAKSNATRLLESYKDKICTFNDDIQGTAAVVLGTLLSAIQVTQIPIDKHKIVIAGAGSAGCGIANLLVTLIKESGISEEEALSGIYLVDNLGLVRENAPHLLPFQKKFGKSQSQLQKDGFKSKKTSFSLKETIKFVKPSILIGVTGQANLFTKEIVKMMANDHKRPIIFPLSNPTSCSEANPADLIKWTDGRVLMGTGSPFPCVIKNGKQQRVDQTNNSYIFPGLGLGIIASEAKRVTEEMFIVAAKTLAKHSPSKKNPHANLLPPLTESRKIAVKIAFEVAKEAIRSNNAKKRTDKQIEVKIQERLWEPVYMEYRKKK
ncbi:MAG: NAD-dependent malic enzyme [Chlamydiae bacterium]|nr:NAD-dependent malic enzyme [Chlamydiota bacterium]